MAEEKAFTPENTELQTSEISQIPDSALSRVLVRNMPLTQEHLNTITTLSDVENDYEKLKVWKDHQTNEKELKRLVAIFIMVILCFEVLVGNLAFFLYGFGILNFPRWVSETFFVGLFGQIVGLVLIIVKGLFPTPKEDPLTQLNRMVDKK
jgi:hypothetical protein